MMRFVPGLMAIGLAMVLLAGQRSLAQAPPKPGPELEHLKQLVGVWDATVSVGGKGTMTYKMDLGGLWLVSEYEGEFGDQKFQGRGLDTYDSAKKKYVTVWADSMST